MPKYLITQTEETYTTRQIAIEAESADLAQELAEDIDASQWVVVYSNADVYIDTDATEEIGPQHSWAAEEPESSRKPTRNERLQGLADRGIDTWDDYREEK